MSSFTNEFQSVLPYLCLRFSQSIYLFFHICLLIDFLWGFVNLKTLYIGQWYRISWFRNGAPTPLKRMLLGLEVSIISIKEDDRSVKCVCSFIIW